jgi:hypothetical protein
MGDDRRPACTHDEGRDQIWCLGFRLAIDRCLGFRLAIDRCLGFRLAIDRCLGFRLAIDRCYRQRIFGGGGGEAELIGYELEKLSSASIG